MGLFKVNHNNIMGKFVEEAGQYNVKILPSSVAKESRSKKPMLVLNYEVEDGDYAGGQIRYDNLVWDDSNQDKKDMSIKRFNTILVACGAPDNYEPNSIQEILTSILNRHISITVDWQQSDYNKQYYLVVKGYGAPLDGGSKPNGVKRPDDNSNYTNKNINSGFSNSNYNTNQQQAQPYGGDGAPIDIDDSQLPF